MLIIVRFAPFVKGYFLKSYEDFVNSFVNIIPIATETGILSGRFQRPDAFTAVYPDAFTAIPAKHPHADSVRTLSR